jgi:hypothetical protein
MLLEEIEPYNCLFLDTIFKAVMPIMDARPLPNADEVVDGSSTALQRVEFAIHSLFLVKKIFDHRGPDRERAQTTMGRFVQWDTVVAWVIFLLRDVAPLLGRGEEIALRLATTSCSLLYRLALITDRSASDFQLPETAEALLLLYTFTHNNGFPLLLIGMEPNLHNCPIIDLLHNLTVVLKASSLAVLESISDDVVEHLLTFSCARLELIIKSDYDHLSAISSIRSLWRVMQCIARCNHSKFKNEFIDMKMLEHEFFRIIMESLAHVAQQSFSSQSGPSSAETLPTIRPLAFETAMEICAFTLASSKPIHSTAQAVHGGFYKLLICHFLPYQQGVAKTGSADASILIHRVILHGVYSKMQQATRESLAGLKPSAFKFIESQVPSHVAMCEFIQLTLQELTSGQPNMKQICDYVGVSNPCCSILCSPLTLYVMLTSCLYNSTSTQWMVLTQSSAPTTSFIPVQAANSFYIAQRGASAMIGSKKTVTELNVNISKTVRPSHSYLSSSMVTVSATI